MLAQTQQQKQQEQQQQQHAQSPGLSLGSTLQKQEPQKQQVAQGQQTSQAVQPAQSTRSASLGQASQAINQCLAHDQAWPELGDILSRTSCSVACSS
jgi:hypothetical protein